jgi:hypothetical protein
VGASFVSQGASRSPSSRSREPGCGSDDASG